MFPNIEVTYIFFCENDILKKFIANSTQFPQTYMEGFAGQVVKHRDRISKALSGFIQSP